MVYEGMVVGLKKRSAVVMTGDCQFIEINRTPVMSSGVSVHFTDADLFKPAVKTPLRFTAIAASLLVCFVLAYSLLQEITGKRAFAYISLEVNPALEISLDQEMKAIKATGLNRDGQDVAKGLKIRGQDAGEAVQAVLNACVESGYMNGNHNQVLLATTFPAKNDQLQEELDHRIWEAARKGVAASQSGVSIYIFNAEPALREEALDKGVSAGRYLLWQDAQSNDLQFDLSDPLTGPGFSRTAGKLSLPFAEMGSNNDNAASGPTIPSTQGGRTDQPSSTLPGPGKTPGEMGHELRDHASPPGIGKGTDTEAEKHNGKPETTKDTPIEPAEGIKDYSSNPDRVPPAGVKDNRPVSPNDAAKSENNSPLVSDPAGGVKGGSSGSAESQAQGTDGSGKSSSSNSDGKRSGGSSSGSGGHSSGGKR